MPRIVAISRNPLTLKALEQRGLIESKTGLLQEQKRTNYYEDTNPINAEVTLNKAEIIGGRYFLVANLSTKEWKDVSLILNHTYTAHQPSLAVGKKMPFYLSLFVDRLNQPPSAKIVVQTLRIECDQGTFEREYFEGSE